jgi:amino-acid N-acetyltransferase
MNRAPTLVVRPASAADQAPIEQLVRSERLNPSDLDWRRFVVASVGDAVVGAVQMRRHPDGSRELASLVVHPLHRGQGISAQLVTALLQQHDGTIHLITPRTLAEHYARWQFRVIAAREASRVVRRNHALGQIFGSLFALLEGYLPRRLVILRRG